MKTRIVIWVDLQTEPESVDLSAPLRPFCELHKIRGIEKVADSILALATAHSLN
jgi:hypothetical protein